MNSNKSPIKRSPYGDLSLTGLARANIMDIKPYVPGKPIDEVAREFGGATGEIIKLASNENPLGPSPLAMKVLNRGIKTLNLYPDDNGYYLTCALAGKLKISEQELILGNGSTEILDFITKAFVNPGDEVIMAEYTFVMYKIITAIAGGKRKAIPLKALRHNLDAMIDAITDRTKVIFIANPNNPTGTMNTAEEVKRFMAHLPDNVLVVFDEAYREYQPPPKADQPSAEDFPDTFQYFRAGRNVIILRTFSKIYGLAGLRLGYGIAKPDLISALRKVRLPFNINSSAQAAGLAALDDEAHIKRSIEVNEEGKDFLYRNFDKIGLPHLPTTANFIFIPLEIPGIKEKIASDIKQGSDTRKVSNIISRSRQRRDLSLTGFTQPTMDGARFSEELMKRGVIVRYLAEQDYQGVRITIGTKQQNQKLIKSIKEVLQENL